MKNLTFSKYIRIFNDIREESVVYNTRNRAIVLLPKEFKNNQFLDSLLSPSDMQVLGEMGFFDETIDAEEAIYKAETNFIISVETMLECNLRCPYCYQIGAPARGCLSDKNIDELTKYVNKVWGKIKFEILTLKILGGEPTLQWKKSKRVIDDFFELSNKLGFKLNVMIDTNGTVIDDILNLKHISNLLLTIPLTFKDCHDSVRKFPSGKGSYNIIINNINGIRKELPNADIVLRYNVDNLNIHYFEQFVADLKESLTFSPIISPNYTMNLGEGGFDNKLSHKEFIHWLSTECTDILLKYDLPIVITPFTLKKPCQYQSKYSLKIFADGSVGSCAMSFFKNERNTITSINNNFDKFDELLTANPYDNPFDNPKCRNCDSLFICGGTYYIPCIKSLGLLNCSDPEGLHINLKEFLSRYLNAEEYGKQDLFVGFNEYNIYK